MRTPQSAERNPQHIKISHFKIVCVKYLYTQEIFIITCPAFRECRRKSSLKRIEPTTAAHTVEFVLCVIE